MKSLKRLLSKQLRASRMDLNQGFVIYIARDCDCSSVAIELLRSRGIEPQIELLDNHPQVRAKHGGATPIVMVDGRLRFFGKVEPVLLDRLLRHR